MSEKVKDTEIPAELRSRLKAFDASLNDVESKFQPLLTVPQNELNEKLATLDKAKLDLVAAYSINSLFWMYLNVCGVNPKDHGIKQELDRIRGYMNRVKEVQEKAKAPTLNVGASKRFIKNALWQAAHEKTEAKEETPVQTPEQPKDKKRKSGKGEKHKGQKKSRYMSNPSKS